MNKDLPKGAITGRIAARAPDRINISFDSLSQEEIKQWARRRAYQEILEDSEDYTIRMELGDA